MVIQEHFNALAKGQEFWNDWREKNPTVIPDLSSANLTGANLTGANLASAKLTGANLASAKLTGATLNRTILVDTNLERAILTDCSVYGCAAWNLRLKGANQRDLIITPHNEPKITVDNLEVAQFIYLLLNNKNIRDVIDTIGKKAVLILGRFTERKHVLEAIRTAVRERDYLPIVFDFERPRDRDFTETVMTLAGMCLFIIADITKPKSVPLSEYTKFILQKLATKSSLKIHRPSATKSTA